MRIAPFFPEEKTPFVVHNSFFALAKKMLLVMDASGFEPEAPRLQSGCSTELSYAPGFMMIVKIKK